MACEPPWKEVGCREEREWSDRGEGEIEREIANLESVDGVAYANDLLEKRSAAERRAGAKRRFTFPPSLIHSAAGVLVATTSSALIHLHCEAQHLLIHDIPMQRRMKQADRLHERWIPVFDDAEDIADGLPIAPIDGGVRGEVAVSDGLVVGEGGGGRRRRDSKQSEIEEN